MVAEMAVWLADAPKAWKLMALLVGDCASRRRVSRVWPRARAARMASVRSMPSAVVSNWDMRVAAGAGAVLLTRPSALSLRTMAVVGAGGEGAASRATAASWGVACVRDGSL